MQRISRFILLTLATGLFDLLHSQEMPFFLPGSDSLETIEQRFPPPEGYQRMALREGSFAAWLRAMPLMPEGSAVFNFRGRQRVAPDDSSLAAVVACRIKNRRLDQCMDIIMRMAAAYLLEQNRADDIAFPLPDGTTFSWLQWSQGYRPVVAGSGFILEKPARPSRDSGSFERYLRSIFSYSGTQAFYHYFPDIQPDDVRIGDFFVKKGGNGHAVLIVDMVEDENGRKKALIGQGDTPACSFYILRDKNGGNWIDMNDKKNPLSLPIRKKMTWDGLRRFVCISKE